MIIDPINDQACLGAVTEFARRMLDERRDSLASLATQFPTTTALARWIRLKPQVDDEGNPDEGPKVYACRPPQRLRVFWETPNCFERTVEYVLLAEFIDPRPRRSMATVKTRYGRHTLPVEGKRAVKLDPLMRQNELEGALFQLDRSRLSVLSVGTEALDWMASVAAEPAAARGEAHRVRNARVAMHAVMAGDEITPQSVADIAYTVDEADREVCSWYGVRGCALHRRVAEELTDALITQRRRNAGFRLRLDNLLPIGSTVLDRLIPMIRISSPATSTPSPSSSGSTDLPSSTSSTSSSGPPSSTSSSSSPPSTSSGSSKGGGGNDLLSELEKLIGKDGIKTGLTIGGIMAGGPLGAQIGSLAGDALIASAFRNAAARNASAWAVKTPGLIFAEIQTTDNAIRALSRDISNAFSEPFSMQQTQAEVRFAREKGRRPGEGSEGDTKADLAQVYRWMQPEPTQADVDAKSYHGAFAYQWGEFTREWGEFYASHTHWYDRLWRGSYDKAIEFRERAVAWRRRFEQLGGTPTGPEPVIPPDRGQGLTESGPWKAILLVAGIGAAALILPEVLRTFRGGRAQA